MPYRSKELLEQWVEEYTGEGEGSPGVIEVLTHDEGAGLDTGLVVIRMSDLPSDVYLHPMGPGTPDWTVNFGPRERDLTMTARKLRRLAQELTRAAALCEFFEGKSVQHDLDSGRASA